MRLRNKKTGEIKDWSCATLSNTAQIREEKHYASLAELNEDWEDYEPKESLIKDEKIRKAVRAWAETEGIKEVSVMCHLVWGINMTEIAKSDNASLRIVFSGDLGIKMGKYTITELCGEEEGCDN